MRKNQRLLGRLIRNLRRATCLNQAWQQYQRIIYDKYCGVDPLFNHWSLDIRTKTNKLILKEYRLADQKFNLKNYLTKLC